MPTDGKILIVDDNGAVLESLTQYFCDDYEVLTASSGSEAVETLKNGSTVDTVILDIRMPGMDGFETSEQIRQIDPELPIIFLSAFAGDYSEEEVQDKFDPFDYVGKNEPLVRLSRTVNNAVRTNQLRSNNDILVDLARSKFGMVGRSESMCKVYLKIDKVADTISRVMILGPTGSGKELVARAIHDQSRRSENRFVTFECSNLQGNLVRSELFGHKKGAFSGAIADHVGKIQYADGGTLFLDEIGDLDLETQNRLLHVLEENNITPLGANEPVEVDVRLLCATNKDLKQMVLDGTFREDLYYRLEGVRITLAPLRERNEDIPLLVPYFADKYCRKSDYVPKIFTPSAVNLMLEFEWKGNIRELRNVVESLLDLTPGNIITRSDVASRLKFEGLQAPSDIKTLAAKTRWFRRTEVIKALTKNAGVIKSAAADLGMDAANLRRTMSEYGLNKSQFDLPRVS